EQLLDLRGHRRGLEVTDDGQVGMAGAGEVGVELLDVRERDLVDRVDRIRRARAAAWIRLRPRLRDLLERREPDRLRIMKLLLELRELLLAHDVEFLRRKARRRRDLGREIDRR